MGIRLSDFRFINAQVIATERILGRQRLQFQLYQGLLKREGELKKRIQP